MDPAVRNYIRRRGDVAETSACGSMAAREPEQLRHAARRQGSADPRCGYREGRRVAFDIPATAANRLLLQSIFVLSQINGRRQRLSNLVPYDGGAGGVAATGAIP